MRRTVVPLRTVKAGLVALMGHITCQSRVSSARASIEFVNVRRRRRVVLLVSVMCASPLLADTAASNASFSGYDQASPGSTAAAQADLGRPSLTTDTGTPQPRPVRPILPTSVLLAQRRLATEPSTQQSTSELVKHKLKFFGGPVEHHVKIYVIFWGSNFVTQRPGEATYHELKKFYRGLEFPSQPVSSWQGIITEYFDSHAFPEARATWAGEWDDFAKAAPTNVSRASLEQEVTEYINAGFAVNANGEKRGTIELTPDSQFVVITAPGSTFAEKETQENCGFHVEMAAPGLPELAYGWVAFAGDKPGCIEEGTQGVESTSVTASHEYAETVTDPLPNAARAWATAEGGGAEEIADLCQQNGAHLLPERESTGGYWVAELWEDYTAEPTEGHCSLEDPPFPPPPPPSVTTKAATGVGATAATVTGSVNPNGPDAHYYFEYGTTKSYGATSPTPPGTDAGFGEAAVPASTTITGLQPSTTYHYRIVASTWTGTAHGTDHKFTTSARGTFSAGAYHTCALLASPGGIDCWGYNYDGELGNGTTKNISTKPVAVSGIASAREVSGGGYHTCALLSASVDCWGYNKFGELGNGTTKDSATPVAVSGLTNAIEVSGGSFYTCALLSSGGIKCWGENGFGELGDGTFTERTTPVSVAGITNAIEVTGGELSTCALISDGSIKCWGYNGFGELGNGSTTPEYSPTPVAVKGITNAVAVSAVGDFHTCALLSTGSIKCWGYNEDGELGNGTMTEDTTTPVQVSGIGNAAGVEAGSFFTCAWRVSAIVNCWGENQFGELGNGTTVNSSTPVPVSGIATATGVTTGISHACARLIGGGVDCWGENLDGQLGNGTTTNSSTPVAVKGLP
jgi:alpha-tubulin suppressor-like RCC1 family protein